MNTSAGRKSPPLTRYPIIIGTTKPATFPQKLNTPPVSPTMFFGDSIDTNTQDIKAMPAPKNASDKKKITIAVSDV